MRQRGVFLLAAAVYGLLLAASSCVGPSELPPLRSGEARLVLPAVGNPEESVELTYRVLGDASAPAVILLHGSPGSLQNFDAFAEQLLPDYRVVVPDLPGFGSSTLDIPDYSMRAHSRYVLGLMDALDLERAHLVGFSMGGGVALNVADQAPDRVASISMIAALGVQEHELLGDYTLNHLIHGAQLAGIWLLHHAVPHFGALDRFPLNPSFARNFFDSDQRPIRGTLERLQCPMLVIHGKDDFLVPFAAAREHHRLVPQSELEVLDAGHLILFQNRDQVAGRTLAFVDSVEAGHARTRANAEPERLALAGSPADSDAGMPRGFLGAAVFSFLVLIASLVSEDLTCIGVGLLVGNQQLGFGLGAVASILALWVGDLMLYAAGRWLGPPLLRLTPWRRLASEQNLARGARKLEAGGPWVFFASRFVPGARLPTYVAAGATRYPIVPCALYLLAAAAVWAPLLVGLAAVIGAVAFQYLEMFERYALLGLLIAIGAALLVIRVLIPLASFRGRRLLLGSWRRLVRWEFWPMWALYPPVAGWIAWLALRAKSLTVLTAVNPAFPASGIRGESKWDILNRFEGAGEFVATTGLLDADAHSVDGVNGVDAVAAAERFMREQSLEYPVVLKPDVGERGKGVSIVRDRAALEAYLAEASGRVLIQEYVAGDEFGVFYVRHPDAASGRIFSITEKRMLHVVGDGAQSLERLILGDERAVCMAPTHLERHASRLRWVPAAGERVALTELGTHSRGSLFLEGAWLETPALAASFEQISRLEPGFFFGRYDVRTPDVEAMRQGRDFKIVELNGLTSEATHIYDPRNSLLDAYRVLFEQWRIAFEIGLANRQAGVETLSLGELFAVLLGSTSGASTREA